MEYRKLSGTDIDLSVICLGTMTWGEQNTPSEAFEQMDYALGQGVNFFDTAELYSVPASADTYGSTERIIGDWFTKSKNRSDVFLATKVAGKNPGFDWIRGEDHQLDRKNILAAVEGSLQRLKTDYIDLYQLHWPDRPVNNFGTLSYKPQDDEAWEDHLRESLVTMNDLVDQGKVRYIGLSNETPWGLMTYLRIAKELNLSKIVTLQNPYSLLNRSFEVGLAEIMHREKMQLLAYSPLAMGVLTGKYFNGQMPDNSRLKLFPVLSRYSGERAMEAAEAYGEIAAEHKISLTQMSLAFVNDQPFTGYNIIGATNMEQLKENIDSINLKLDDEVLSQIEDVHNFYTYPAP